MDRLVTATLALAGAILVSGCGGGGGGGGSAFPTFDPFGSEPAGSSSESAGTSTEGKPASAGAIAELCATDCGRIMSACPTPGGLTCVPSCEAAVSTYPQCAALAEVYLTCVSSIAITCASNGSPDLSACEQSQLALSSCTNPGTPSGAGSGR